MTAMVIFMGLCVLGMLFLLRVLFAWFKESTVSGSYLVKMGERQKYDVRVVFERCRGHRPGLSACGVSGESLWSGGKTGAQQEGAQQEKVDRVCQSRKYQRNSLPSCFITITRRWRLISAVRTDRIRMRGAKFRPARGVEWLPRHGWRCWNWHPARTRMRRTAGNAISPSRDKRSGAADAYGAIRWRAHGQC